MLIGALREGVGDLRIVDAVTHSGAVSVRGGSRDPDPTRTIEVASIPGLFNCLVEHLR
jgi:hypothetical protein